MAQTTAPGWLAIALTLVFGGAGCGSDAGSTEPDEDTGSPEDVTPDVALDAEPDTTEADAVETDTAEPDTAEDADEDTVEPELPDGVALLYDDEVQLVDGASDPITFEVPAGATTVTVTIRGDIETHYVLGEWMDASDNVLVPNGWVSSDTQAPMLCTSCLNRVAAANATFAALAPNNEASVVAHGEHLISVYAFEMPSDLFGSPTPANGTAEVTVWAKVMAEEPQTGVLDLNLFFTGVRGWSAATAPEDADFQQLLADVGEIYAQVGITLGELDYYDVDASYEVIEGLDGPDGDLTYLFMESEQAEREAINVFFVGELMQGGPLAGFGTVLGIAGGIPGPPLEVGTPRSGVAIAVTSHELDGIPAELRTTMAHEVGHFLGLFHTSEQDFGFGMPQIHDPIADTPENDPSYLMYNTGEGSTLSTAQGEVMRRNPWTRHPEGDE